MSTTKTFMLFGKAGVGKSATSNTLSGTKAFKSKRNASAVTLRAQAINFDYEGISFCVVDTIGLDSALFKE